MNLIALLYSMTMILTVSINDLSFLKFLLGASLALENFLKLSVLTEKTISVVECPV